MGSQNRSFRRWTKLKSADKKKNEILRRFELFEIPDKSCISISFSIFLTGGPQTKRLWCETSNFFWTWDIIHYDPLPNKILSAIWRYFILYDALYLDIVAMRNIHCDFMGIQLPITLKINFLVMYPACFGINSFWWK